jgi:hypothetical protein
MSWINNFIAAFAQQENNYLMRDQRDIVKEFGNMSQQNQNQLNSQKDSQDNDAFRLESQDATTGEEFSVDIKSEKNKPKSKKELEWINREKTVTFTSLTNKNKFITSDLKSLCGGKYAELTGKPLQEIAETLASNYNDIFNYVDASIAQYSEKITPDQAFRVAKSVTSDNKISYFDYEKITAKLNDELSMRFNDMLKGAGIKIFYPMIAFERENLEAANKKQLAEKDNMERQSSLERKNKEINYYVNYIKDFKEYKLGNKNGLEVRMASVINLLNKDIKESVLAEFKKDPIFKNSI